MCYSATMQRIAVRELRNQASRVVRRARAGERLIITVDGVPAAEIGPVSATVRAASLDELIATGAVVAALVRTPPPPPKPVPVPSGRSSSDVLIELRER
jgi:prevent-host-death family protein